MSLIMKNGAPCNGELWETFMDSLDDAIGAEVCDAQTLRLSKRILETDELFDSVDTGRTLLSFQERGGYCDCEVLMNVVDRPLTAAQKD